MGEPARVLDAANKGEGEDGEEAVAAVDDEEGEEGVEKVLNSDETEEEEITVPKRDLTELDRLTFVVYAIENDCQICPVGSFKMTSEHQVRRNEAFCGLKKAESSDLDCYAHFRNVQNIEKKEALDSPSASFNPRFLESAKVDQPQGTWMV